jgi:hypothetical protein
VDDCHEVPGCCAAARRWSAAGNLVARRTCARIARPSTVWQDRRRMTTAVAALIHEYTRRYVAHDVEGVTDLCVVPFLAIREGRPIHLADRDAIHDHFMTVMDAYRSAGFSSFSPVEIDTRHLGDHAAFTTVRWHALGPDGGIARDSRTTYHVLATESGWRFLSYTNHF